MIPDSFDARVSAGLISWYRAHGVSYPWGDSPDPWGVWVSEVMLQQTTVGAVESRYRRWMERFPVPASLAAAGEEEILREWEGLGYYNRARNLAAAAAEVQNRYGGRVPDDEAVLRSLPGVGPYIAAAVASFAYGRRSAAIDANGRRIAQRLSAQDSWTAALETAFRARIESLMPPKNPGEMNAALMQLGQLVCVPGKPDCPACPLNTCCLAFAGGLQNLIPPRRAVRAVRMETDLALLVTSGRVAVRRRASGVGKGLWFFPRADEIERLEEDWRMLARLPDVTHTYTRYRELLRPAVYEPSDKAGRDGRRPLPAPAPGAEFLTPDELGQRPMASAYRRIAGHLNRLFSAGGAEK